MSDESPPPHPPAFRRLCAEAVEGFRALAAADAGDRGRMIPALRELLARIDQQVDELDIALPGFAREQGWLVDASSALQSIDLDRGGPHVPRYVARAIADIERVSG
ncbi:hypothetical protein [Longimicrobium sp.]|uniref:hypothetical protein n=1 Tax=Longimicrobium sp. TaxID=2029185 RepID=UPI002C2B23D5|nr:hypothetical protein [Longimicrobium sp.]HSU13154.1 hypothetical protein [Longimicrobium sp.]